MTSVEQLIGNLLLRHNCVIIPSFGGFVAQRVSARIDYSNGTMMPPGKSILFNRQLLNNDGLLINEYANENEVSYDQAAQELKLLVSQWQSALNAGGRIEIERVGNLYFDEERNICFEQDRFANLLLESFGLGSVHFVTEEDVRIVEQRAIKEEKQEVEVTPIPSVREEKTVTKVAAEIEEEEPETLFIPIAKATPVPEEKEATAAAEPVDVTRTKNRSWRYVAAACILPIAFYSIWIPVKTDVLESGMLSFSDFNPFHKRSEGTYKPAKESSDWKPESTKETSLREEIKNIPEDVYTYELTSDTYIKVALPKSAEITPDESTNETDAIPNTPHTNELFDANKMHYVVGCFGDKSNAENLVARLKANGLDASIVDVKGGLHRVSAGGAISEEAYQTIKLKADSMGLSGWRLR